MEWIYLLIAGVLEVIWSIGLKYSEHFTKLVPSVITIIATFLSFWFLGLALRVLPLGTAYAIWTGIGIIGTALVGVFYFGEPIALTRIISFLFIVVGIIGLKIFV